MTDEKGAIITVLEAEHLYKVFGRRSQDVVAQLEAGADPAELKRQDAVPAVIDANFEVQQGEIFVVMGLSGSGKSTLIRMLNGLHPPSAGRVLIHGRDISAMSASELRAARRDHISMVFQHFALFPHRTVAENAAYGLKVKVKGMDAATRRAKALEAPVLVDLADWAEAKPSELSGGMQQRVGLARALAADTDILLMDEAFSALDPLIRRTRTSPARSPAGTCPAATRPAVRCVAGGGPRVSAPRTAGGVRRQPWDCRSRKR